MNNEGLNNGIAWLDKVLQMVEKYRIKTIFKAIFVILLIAATVGFISNPTYVFEEYAKWANKQHQELIERRIKNNEKLHIKAEQLMYRVGADRVLVLELHNGMENNAGLPFSKCSATYEAINSNIRPIADQYQNINLSLMPFAAFLGEKGYWCGNVEDIEKIDRGLYYKMLSNNTTHFAACVIEGVEKPLAFLFVSFSVVDDSHKCEEVREAVRHIALETALLLELNK